MFVATTLTIGVTPVNLFKALTGVTPGVAVKTAPNLSPAASVLSIQVDGDSTQDCYLGDSNVAVAGPNCGVHLSSGDSRWSGPCVINNQSLIDWWLVAPAASAKVNITVQYA